MDCTVATLWHPFCENYSAHCAQQPRRRKYFKIINCAIFKGERRQRFAKAVHFPLWSWRAARLRRRCEDDTAAGDFGRKKSEIKTRRIFQLPTLEKSGKHLRTIETALMKQIPGLRQNDFIIWQMDVCTEDMKGNQSQYNPHSGIFWTHFQKNWSTGSQARCEALIRSVLESIEPGALNGGWNVEARPPEADLITLEIVVNGENVDKKSWQLGHFKSDEMGSKGSDSHVWATIRCASNSTFRRTSNHLRTIFLRVCSALFPEAREKSWIRSKMWPQLQHSALQHQSQFQLLKIQVGCGRSWNCFILRDPESSVVGDGSASLVGSLQQETKIQLTGNEKPKSISGNRSNSAPTPGPTPLQRQAQVHSNPRRNSTPTSARFHTMPDQN